MGHFARFGTVCTILKNVKSTHGRVLPLKTVQVEACTLLKVKLLHGCFSCFLKYTNGTKSRKASQINKRLKLQQCIPFGRFCLAF